MPDITINFNGPLRLFLNTRSVRVNVNNIEEARDYVERNFGHAFKKKLQSMGINKNMSIGDTSNILLNGKSLQLLNTIVLKEGDRLDFLSRVAGG